MTRWKQDETQFPVKIQYNEKRGSYVVIPKPIIDKLNEPDEVIFEIKHGGKIITLKRGR